MPVYFISYTVLFWVPSILFLIFLYRPLQTYTRKAFWLTVFIMAVVSVIMEYLYLKFDVWGFSERIDPLLGIWIWKAPIEEYVYWFGATPFCLSLYLAYCRLFEKLKSRNKNA